MTNPIDRVVIVGGTHGNEWTGIYLLKKFEQLPQRIQRSSFRTEILLANPKAFAANRRYLDRDLNRSFSPLDLQDDLAGYENLRAREIYQRLAAVARASVNLILDLHSTTANMGVTLIADSTDAFYPRLAAAIVARYPSVRFYCSAHAGRNQDSLRRLGDYGLCLEVGPVAPGLLDAALLQQTEAIVSAILDYLEQYNQGNFQDGSPEAFVTVYRYLKAIDYPRSPTGELLAMIHPRLQGQDYHPLYPGDPIFLTFDDREICYEGEAIVYPVFINEAAYYEKGIAMCLTEKQQVQF